MEMTIIEAAERLGVSENAVRKRIRRGSIEARKDGDRWFVTVEPSATVEANEQTSEFSQRDQRDQVVDLLERENEFLRGQIEAKDRLIELLLDRRADATGEISSHLRHAIDGLIGGRSVGGRGDR
jgi:excisionase family DNA binding protein